MASQAGIFSCPRKSHTRDVLIPLPFEAVIMTRSSVFKWALLDWSEGDFAKERVPFGTEAIYAGGGDVLNSRQLLGMSLGPISGLEEARAVNKKTHTH